MGKSNWEITEEARKKTSDISFRFGEKDKLQPKGFGSISPEAPVTIVLKGTVSNFSTGDEYDKSKRLTIIPESIEVITDSDKKTVSISEAIASADKTRKKVKG